MKRVHLISPLRSVGTVLPAFLVLNIILVSTCAAVHFQGAELVSSGGTGSETLNQSYGRCELTPETPPVIRCGINPTENSYVDNYFPDKSFATLYWLPGPAIQAPPNPVLIVQNTVQHNPQYGDISMNYAYLKFDWAALLPQELLLSHAEPKNATLWLYVRYVVPSYNASIRVYRVLSNDWEEKKLTWETKPTWDETAYAETSIRANGTWVPWDVTQEVRAAVKGGSMISLVVMASETSWTNLVWFDSNHQALEGNVSTRPELDMDFAAPALTVQTSYPSLPITVDNKTFQTDQRGVFRAFVAWGNHQIEIPEIIPVGEGTRVRFVGWSDNITEPQRTISVVNNMTLQANYETQYYLNVTSPHGSVNGSGWYNIRNMATISVNPTIVLEPGFLGSLGGKLVFQAWTVDSNASTATANIIMDAPKTVQAEWTIDNSQPYMIIGGIGAGILAATILAFLLIRRKHRREIQ